MSGPSGDVSGREPRQSASTTPIANTLGGFGRDITPTVFSPVSMFDNQPYPFGAADQYFTLLEKGPTAVPSMDNAVWARRIPIPPGTRYFQFLEVQIDTQVGVDEDFEIELQGFAHNPSGTTLLKNEALSAFDTPVKLTLAAGRKGSPRTASTLYPTTIGGGTPATHFVVKWHQAGGLVYPGLVSAIVAFKP